MTLNGEQSEIRIIVSSEEKYTNDNVKIQQSEQNFRMMQSVTGTIVEEYIYTIPIGQQIPEFAVILYDDNNYSITRPVYNGCPVISTIPVEQPDVIDPMGDWHFYSLGYGPASRKIYAKVRSNIDIRIPQTFGMYLDLYGVQPELRVIRVSDGEILFRTILVFSAVENNKYSYNTEFDFYKTWGDGEILLFDVYFKMKIYNTLPICFSVGTRLFSRPGCLRCRMAVTSLSIVPPLSTR